jgi:uncharacterized damage-inducible protein DinB
MKEILRSFATYHIWANQKLMDLVLSLSEEKQKAEVPSSFNSLYKTALHMWNAESIWWQRITSPSTIVPPQNNFDGTMQDIVNSMELQSQQWLAWINEMTDESLLEQLHYKTLKGESFSQPLKDVALHIFNHGTYHRGQIVNMFRQLGVTSAIPQTDYTFWSRNNN